MRRETAKAERVVEYGEANDGSPLCPRPPRLTSGSPRLGQAFNSSKSPEACLEVP